MRADETLAGLIRACHQGGSEITSGLLAAIFDRLRELAVEDPILRVWQFRELCALIGSIRTDTSDGFTYPYLARGLQRIFWIDLDTSFDKAAQDTAQIVDPVSYGLMIREVDGTESHWHQKFRTVDQAMAAAMGQQRRGTIYLTDNTGRSIQVLRRVE